MGHYEEFPWDGGARFMGLSVNEFTDANSECRHGRLPCDPSPPCGCWTGWEAEVTVLPQAKPMRRRRRAA